MLIELKVHQFAIIHHLDLSFKSGLNIISGETGAGKSVVLKSLALLMGGKAESGTVRIGADQAIIEGLFELEARPDVLNRLKSLGISVEEDHLIVRRVINAQGKSKVYLNGQLCPLSTLRDTVAPLITLTSQSEHFAPLIEMTGQHENRDLQTKAFHLELLDQYAGLGKERQDFLELFERYHQIIHEIKNLESDSRQSAQKLDFLKFQRDEIQNLALKEGEEESLEAQVRKNRHGAKISEFINLSQEWLYGDDQAVSVRLHHILSKAAELKNTDPDLFEKVQGLQQAKSLVEDTVYELREHSRSLISDPDEGQKCEERLSQIRKLTKKYGGTVSTITTQLVEIENEIHRLENAGSQLNLLKTELNEIEKSLKDRASNLHQKRQKASVPLVKKVNAELDELNMKGVIFGIHLDHFENLEHFMTTGNSDLEFTIQSSKKDDPRPIGKFASGGELSRILLSLKKVVGQGDLPRTYLFDEVDSGVSGETAEKVGRKLKAIAKGQQVICVTHLPQVAAFADFHFMIQKSQNKELVEMSVTPLNMDQRVREIARLISGEKISSSSLDHAKQLILDIRKETNSKKKQKVLHA